MNKDELIEVLMKHADKIFFYCVKRCNSRIDAEDLSQDILLDIIININKGIEIKNFDYYIWKICKNHYSKYVNKKVKERENVTSLEKINKNTGAQVFNNTNILDELVANEKIALINTSIKLLSHDYSEILYSYYIEDKTIENISKNLNLPLGTVKKRLFDIRNKLKEYLKMERLNGKKAYVPKSFSTIANFDNKLPFDVHETVRPLFVKNLLWHTYDNLCTIEDLSIEMGMAKPYVEDIVGYLLGRNFLLQEGNKYKSNVVFITDEIVKDVDCYIKSNENFYLDEIIRIANNNLNYYQQIVDNKEISSKELMWSLISMINGFIIEKPMEKRTKKYGDADFSFCLIEYKKEYDRNDFMISWNGFGDRNKFGIDGSAFPAAPNDNQDSHLVHKRISMNRSNNGFSLDPLLISKVIKNNLKYNELDTLTRNAIDRLINLNVLKVNNNIVQVVMPVISQTDYIKLRKKCLSDEILMNLYMNLYNNVSQIVENNIPNYLKDDVPFIISSLMNPIKSHLLIRAYEQGLLSMDEEHNFFAYNMYIIKY